ncbi:hypothetical protein COCNU_scaffold000732G000040 [Cocos nucifera]|nr:hypothetical protein [Cocos nucifera]
MTISKRIHKTCTSICVLIHLLFALGRIFYVDTEWIYKAYLPVLQGNHEVIDPLEEIFQHMKSKSTQYFDMK